MSKMPSKIVLIIIVLIVNSLGEVHAQSTIPMKRLIATEWSDKSAGLLSNNVTNVMQSSSGYIWLTTYNGIQKFDGYKTKTFDQNQLPFLRSSGFRKIYKSPLDDSFYFASQSSGVIKFSEDLGFQQVQVKKGSVPPSVEDVLIDESGRMWVGSVNEGLSFVKNDSAYKFEHPIIQKSNVLSLVESKKGSIILGTEGDGVFEIDGGEVIAHYNLKDGLSSDIVNVVAAVEGKLYMGTQAGVDYLEGNQLYSMNFMNGESVNCMLHSGKYLWLGSDNGLGRINLETGEKEFISSLGFIDITRINDIMIDSEGSIWLATGRNGLVQLKETGIINYNRFDGFENDNVNIVTERSNGQGFFIGCDDGNIFTLNSNQVMPFPIRNAVKPTGIRDIHEQEDGTIWIASYKGLIRKRGEEEKVYGLEDGLMSLDLRRILEDKNGVIWVASRSGGLIKIKNDKAEKIFNRTSGLKSDFILSIEEDAVGNLYLGTHSGGVTIIKPDESIENISISNNDQGIIVFNTHVENSSRIWAVTTAGLYLLEDRNVKKLRLRKNYKGVSMFDWLEDQSGDVWITTNQGLIKIERNEIESFLGDPEYEVESRLITKSDGMYESECTGAVRSLRSQDGRLLIPTLGGVSVISPSQMNENKSLPTVIVENLELQDTTIKNSQNVILESKSNRYKFNFTALTYLAPDAIQFKYKLQGLESEFNTVSGVRSAEYTNLSPGEYTFLVFATNNHGKWTKEAASFHFVIKPAFHETVWFYVLMAVLLALVIYSIYEWRVRGVRKMNKKLIKVNNELDGFVYSASHDLRSPLASLLGLINLSRKDSDNATLYLDKMEKSVKRLDDFIAEIIDFSSNERKEVECNKVNFESSITRIIDELSFLDEGKKVEIDVNIEQSAPFNSDERRIAVIFRNLISNALKYHDDSKDNPYLKIHVKSNSTIAEITIQDNGIGISKDEHEEVFKMFYRATERSSGSGLGLYIILETVQKLNGTIKMESEKYQGTKFYIEIPFIKE